MTKFLATLVGVMGAHFLVSCGDDVNQNVNMTVTSEAADGLDLEAAGCLDRAGEERL